MDSKWAFERRQLWTNKRRKSIYFIKRISVATIDELWNQQFKYDYGNQDKHSEMSREDLQFMDSVSQSARLAKAHYCVHFPLKNKGLCLPQELLVLLRTILPSWMMWSQRAMQQNLLTTKSAVFHQPLERCGTFHTIEFTIPKNTNCMLCLIVALHTREPH